MEDTSSKISTILRNQNCISMLFLVSCLLSLGMAEACKPKLAEADVTLAYQMSRSDVVIYGYPRNRKVDTRYKDQDLYYVDFEVRCIFKGAPLDEMIRIEQVGGNDTQCRGIEMMKDNALLVYLKRKDSKWVPAFKEDPATAGFLDEVPAICGVTINFPNGITDANKKETCPEEYTYDDDCVQLPTFPTPADNDDSHERGTDNSNSETTEKEASYKPVKSGDLTQNGEEGGDNPGGGAGQTMISLASVLMCVFCLLALV